MSIDLAKLREPFAEGQIGKLPRTICPDCSKSSSKVCSSHAKRKCEECGNYMTERHIHLDYVGHAQVTDRLLNVDPEWTWEPCGWTSEGTPAVRFEQGGRAVLWIKLTVGGVTRLGVGIVSGGKPECEKELIGDALRNAAMRFGVALDLWAKGDLHGEDSEAPAPSDQETVDWRSLGWEVKQDYDDEYAEVVAHTLQLDDDRRAEIKAWLSEFSKPYHADVIAEWRVKIEDRPIVDTADPTLLDAADD